MSLTLSLPPKLRAPRSLSTLLKDAPPGDRRELELYFEHLAEAVALLRAAVEQINATLPPAA